MILFHGGKKYVEQEYSVEEVLEKEIAANSKLFFGENTIYIDAKKKIQSGALGGAVPDGYLFSLSDIGNPEFYLVEAEITNHSFHSHILSQITNYINFLRGSESQIALVEKLFSIINSSPDLKAELKRHLGDTETYKFIKDAVTDSENILLIMDGEKPEITSMRESSPDTWGKMVKSIVLRKFVSGNDAIYTLDPEFDTIEYAYSEHLTEGEKGKKAEYSEGFHIVGVEEVIRGAYLSIKEQLLKVNNTLVFNPQRYYISIVHKKNIAYFRFSKKRMRLVVMLPEAEVRVQIKKHYVKRLSAGVQNFYGASCCGIVIENTQNIDEVIDLLESLVKENKESLA